MYTFGVTYKFAAFVEDSHSPTLLNRSEYEVSFVFKNAVVSSKDTIINTSDIDELNECIYNDLNDSILNELMEENPTLECLAKFIFEKFNRKIWQLNSVQIKNENKFAIYEPDINHGIIEK
jgi:6-pyruvoyl-tetrahydropterin synthase